jgi:hypothetical protein
MVMRRFGARLAAPLAVAFIALGVPAAAQAGVASCPSQPAGQVFLPWLDPAWYRSVPDGGLEDGGAGWRLRGGAAVVAGNERYFVRAPSDRRSLSLPPGAAATSAPTCIAPGHPTLRFFVRNTGSPLARLAVFAEFADLAGVKRSLPIGVVSGPPDWAPSPLLPVVVDALSVLGVTEVAFRFDAAGGDWRVDDVYVDPYGKG